MLSFYKPKGVSYVSEPLHPPLLKKWGANPNKKERKHSANLSYENEFLRTIKFKENYKERAGCPDLLIP